jgi:hypothetical protein
MSNRHQGSKSTKTIRKQRLYDFLKFSDLVILQYLFEVVRDSGGEICIASIPKIANACDLSERQVQISTRRLTKAKLLKKLGYDFANPARKKRGTVYKILINGISITKEKKCSKDIKKEVKFLLLWKQD